MNNKKTKSTRAMIKGCVKSIKIPLILFLGYTVLHNFFESLFTKIWVKPVLSTISSNDYLDILLLIGVALIIIRFIYKLKINYYIDNRHLSVNIILLLTYIYYRYFDSTWAFLPTKSFEQVAYMDGLAFLFLANILQRFFYKKANTKGKTTGFFVDNPVGKKGTDLLNREEFAKEVAKKIENTYFPPSSFSIPPSSFSIGIVGEWGTGKTSFLDLIKRNLPDSVIKIDFNPWLSSDTRSISKDFFNILSENLRVYNSSLSNDFKQYSDIVASTQHSSLSELINIINGIIENSQSLDTDFEKLNTAINKIGKKVVVFVDDLDRLNKKEIFEIIRIIRNIANFKNFIFITAYDRNYLINAIRKVNNYNAENFLEKIFQLEIRLPKYEEERVKDKLIELIGPSLLDEDKTHLNSLLYPKGATIIFFISKNLLISTLRDATRFANSFLIVYELLKGEVYFSDLFRMELLRLKFPRVYQLVFLSKSDYFKLESFKNNVFFTLKQIQVQKNDEKTKSFKLASFLKDNKSVYHLSDEQIDTIIKILNGIFPIAATDALYDSPLLHKNSAAIPENFERYFHYHLLGSDLSEVEFSNFRKKSLKEFLKQIDKWIEEGKSNRLKRKFERIDGYSNREEFEKTIKSIFYFARHTTPDRSDKQIGFEGDNLLDKIAKNKGTNTKLYYNGKSKEYEQFITSVFKEATMPYLFDMELIYYFQSRNYYEDVKLLPEDELNNLRLGYFKYYLSGITKFDNNVWYLYRYCDLIINRDLGVGPKVEPNIEAKRVLIEFITKKDIDGFIKNIIVNEPVNNSLFTIKDVTLELFGDYDQLLRTLQEDGNIKSEYFKEFEKFIEAVKEGSSEYTKFNFKTIPVDKK